MKTLFRLLSLTVIFSINNNPVLSQNLHNNRMARNDNNVIISQNSLYSLEGSWVGAYRCGQGVTGLILEINVENSDLEAVFNFLPIPENPDVPEGSFRMRGTYNVKSRRLKLKAANWINKPSGYLTVDLDGIVSRSGKSISGKVLGANCSVFKLKKS